MDKFDSENSKNFLKKLIEDDLKRGMDDNTLERFMENSTQSLNNSFGPNN